MMSKESFIAVVGSANVDLTTFNDAFPRPGETIFGKKFDLGFGGKGANQAVAARLCGANVGMVAKVGSDLFGPPRLRTLNRRGLTRRMCASPRAFPAASPRSLWMRAAKTASSS